MSNDVHFLGEYTDIKDVWKLYPNGGNFGDYILIGEEYIYWNEYTRSWGEQSELEGTVRPAEIVDHDIHVLGKGTFDYGVSFGDYIPGESGADIDGSGNGELRTIKIDNAFIKDPISGQYIALSDYIKKFKTELPPDWDEYSKSILFDDVRILVFDAASNNKYYTTIGDLKKLISDSIGETGGGGEVGTIEVVRSDDPDAILTDNNVLSSLRTLQEISRLENSSHSHSNKDILDKLSQLNIDVLSKLSLDNGKLKIDTDVYSTGEVSAYGAGDGTGGGGVSYDRLDSWSDYTSDKAGWVLSALLGNDLNTRVSNIEANSALNISLTGTGNALTSVSKSGNTLTFTKDLSFALENHTHSNYLLTSLKGAANGLAELDANGFVPTSQLPSYVDDVLEYDTLSNFPATGTTGKIYVATDTNLTYRWSGSTYVEISKSLALGETSSTAYRGDRGKIAYDHSQVAGGVHITSTERTNWNIAYANNHTHSNKTIIDQISQANLDVLALLSVDNGKLKINADTYSTGEISAYGAGTGGGGTSFNRLDSWADYSSDKSGWVLSALLGNDLNTRLSSVEAGSATSISLTGSGNAVTNVAKSGNIITFTKGLTFSESTHNHDGVYLKTETDPIFSAHTVKNIVNGVGFLKNNNGTWSYDNNTYSLSSHNHSGVYEPLITKSTGYLYYTGSAWSFKNESYSLTSHNHTGVYQPLDADLTAIAALSGTSGLLRKTAANTWSLDTNAYLTGNQTITISGDATGSGTTAITLTLANSGVTAGTYNNVATQVRPFTVDSKGRITSIGAAVTIAPAWGSITSKPTTITGYGITDAYTKTEVNSALALKLDKSVFDDLFEKVEISTGVYAIKAKYNFYSIGEVSAFGAGSGSGGGSSYNRLDAWIDYDSTKSGWVLSALLGVDLNNRLSNVEGGSATSVSITGTGDVIVGGSKSGNVITLTRGNQSWDNLSGKPATFTPASHTHQASDITSGIFNIARIPTGTSDTTVALGNHLHAGVYEPAFTKNTAFNKNFGTTAGTVAEGNDSRIINGQTAYNWGNHASAGYALNSAFNTHNNDNIRHITGAERTKWDKVVTDFDNLEIGGRNLLISSNLDRLAKNFTYNTTKHLKARINYYFNFIVELEPNTEYVVSNKKIIHDGSGGEAENTLRLAIYNASTSAQKQAIGRLYSGSSISFKTNSNITQTDKLLFYPTGSTQIDFEVFELKLEKGNKPTDYAPAPEDQVSDWLTTDVDSFSFIKNKPTLLSQFTDNIGVASHIANKANPHNVTKAQVGLGNVDNTADSVKNVLSATKLTTPRTIAGVSFDGTANIAIPFANLSSKPTTLSGYGITDVYTKTEVNAALALKLDKSTFDDLFEKVEVSTGVYAIKAKYNFYSIGEVSAYGAGSGSGGGSSYNRLDSWADYDSSKSGWVLSALLGIDLNNRLSNVEGGSATSVSITGTGDVIVGGSKSGNVITLTKGNQSWDNLSGKPATFTPASHTHQASDITSGIFNIARIPTGTSDTTVALGNHLHTGIYEPVFTKNTAFNKNFGTTEGTVAEGNDSRIINGQTAYSWGNHASAGYALNSAFNTHNNDNIRHITGAERTKWDKVVTDFDNLEIGGRNLLINSNFKTTSFNGWNSIYGTHQITENGYLKTYTKVSTSARIEKSFHLDEVGIFTFSVKVKTDIAIDWRVWVGLSILNINIKQIEDDFEIHSITFSNSIGGDKIIRGYQSDAPIGTTVLIEWEQLEKGNKATDWTPAPEDQVSDWSVTDVNSFAFIKNKPTQLSQFTDNIGVASHIANKANPHNVTTAQIGAVDLTTNQTIGGNKSFTGNVTAPTFIGALSGNASSATKLQTARTIWGQSFDGTANVSGALTSVTDITASGTIQSLYGKFTNLTTNYLPKQSSSGLVNSIIYDNGTNVGIGTASPQGKLDIQVNTNKLLTVSELTSMPNMPEFTVGGAQLGISRPSDGSRNIVGMAIYNDKSLFIGAYRDVIIGSGALNTFNYSREAVRIASNGNVGIGTTTPAYKLDVNGTGRFTGTVTAPTFSGALAGNATTATTLQTARLINGTSFNGSADITTANWGTARTLTIGNTGKSVNGSANISWSLAEIGAAAVNQTMYIGTTAVNINRASATLNLTGIGSLAMGGALTGATTIAASTSITTPKHDLGNGWAMVANGSEMQMQYNGAAKMRFLSDGSFVAVGEVTAYS